MSEHVSACRESVLAVSSERCSCPREAAGAGRRRRAWSVTSRDESGGGGARRDDHGDRDPHQHQSHGRLQRDRQLHLHQSCTGTLPRRGRARRFQEIQPRQTSKSTSTPRFAWTSSLTVGELEESVTVTGEAPMLQTDRTDTGRIIESDANHADATRVQSELPGRCSSPCRARRARSARTRSSTTRRKACRATSTVRRGSRTTSSSRARTTATTAAVWRSCIPSAEAIETVVGHDEQLRRGVRPGRRRGDERHAEIGTNDVEGLAVSRSATPRRRWRATRSRRCRRRIPTYMQAGFTLGGPIKRNKLFFFGDYVRTNDDSGRLTRGPRARGGVQHRRLQCERPTIIYDPATGNADGSGPNAVPEQSDPGQSHQPDRAAAARQDSDAEHSRRAGRADQL